MVAQAERSTRGRTAVAFFSTCDDQMADVRDADLVASLREMDDAVFSWVVHHYQPSLVQVARRFVDSEAAAEDVVQETWIAVLRGVASFEGRSSFKTWLFRILINRARTRGVQDRRSIPFSHVTADLLEGEPALAPRAAVEQSVGDRSWPGSWVTACSCSSYLPEEWVASRELDGRVEECLARLPQGQRGAITLHDLLGWTSADACAALGVSEGNLRVLLHRARSRVRADLMTCTGGDEALTEGSLACWRRSFFFSTRRTPSDERAS
jgi:RNA polymerase sigma-70 factor (ECF subfamily)